MNSRLLSILFCTLFYHVAAAQQRDTLIRIEAQPAMGFNYPCLLYLPAECSPLFHATLLVEPNNTGIASDSFDVHYQAAVTQATRGALGHYLAEQLRMPLLVPVFPRPETEWRLYSHMLDRDVLRLKKGDLKRIDLQLLAMVNVVREKLFEMGYVTEQQIMMTGFSSAGVFANRFAALHPLWVKGYAAGGINGMPILPVTVVGSAKLNYPIGINDYKKIKGEDFDSEAFKRVKQFLYMGDEDSNDAVLFDDGYSKKERHVIFKTLGKSMMPDRWMRSQEIYNQAGVQADFKTYVGIGHTINEQVRRDLVAFFRQVIASQREQ
jgi:hypothetical protein